MFQRRLPPPYRDRESSLEMWTQLGFDTEVVAKLLTVVASAFRLTEEDARRLRPDDKLWPIYHSYYSRWWQQLSGDELEMETLIRDLEPQTASDGTIDLHPEVTLGELVRAFKV
jgi:hypothetical protein